MAGSIEAEKQEQKYSRQDRGSVQKFKLADFGR